VNAVPCSAVLSAVIGKQVERLGALARKRDAEEAARLGHHEVDVAGLTFEAAMIRSPSFSRSASSITTIMRPARTSAIAASTSANARIVDRDDARAGERPARHGARLRGRLGGGLPADDGAALHDASFTSLSR
jgi:hypothetical protein